MVWKVMVVMMIVIIIIIIILICVKERVVKISAGLSWLSWYGRGIL
jgi:hypothetical protein